MLRPRVAVAAFSLLMLRCCLPIVFAEEMRIVAVVNDEPITQTELNQAFVPVYLQMQNIYSPEELATKTQEIKERILQQLIEERLMLQEAKNPHSVEVSKGKIGTPPVITVSDDEVAEMVKDVSSKFETPEAFSEALAEQGVTLEDLKARYRNQVIIRKLIDREIRSRIIVSPAEVTTYYDAHRKEFEAPPAVQVAVIIIKPKSSLDPAEARDLASHLHQQLTQGADFYDLAKRYSDGPNAKMGGRLGFIEKGKSLKEIDQALFSLSVGQITPVIKASTGFHIFRVEAVRPARQAELDEVKDKVRDRLFQDKTQTRFKDWIAKLKAESYISVK